ncbi:MAG: fumarylacetoacetate hydrolase family protein [Thiotrichales bacterium]
MLLVTFADDAGTRIGVLEAEAGSLVDLARIDPELPREMVALITLGTAGLARVRGACVQPGGRIALSTVRLVAPIPRPPRNIFCVGKNYRDHVKEVQATLTAPGDGIPQAPIIFTKATTAVIGPGVAIPSGLDPTASVDYEGELAVIIGPGGRGIAREAAMEHVYGYTLLNDVTSRRLQRHHQQWFVGKSLDGFCPMGPAILTTDAVPEVGALRLETRVNGELRQDGRVAELIFDIPTLIETLSRGMTLEPGDVIATGTPAGVGMGFDPPRFLRPGDWVSIHVAEIGTLENPVA